MNLQRIDIAALALAALLFVALFSPTAWAAGGRIEIFTIAGVPVTHVPASATVVELDLPARLDHRLSMGMPNDKEAAIQMVKQRIGELKDDYGRAYRGLLRAWRLGVKKVPAVVVGGQYVIYGQPNVATALAAIRDARAREDTP